MRLAVLRMHVGLLHLTDKGAVASWPHVQRELTLLLGLGAPHAHPG